jgi:integrase/recombinase XerD
MAMGLHRQAKLLSDVQLRNVLRFVDAETGFPERNRVVVLLAFKAGLRAKEVACVTWGMLLDAEGNLGHALALQNCASKGRAGGRVIPLHPELKAALEVLYRHEQARGKVSSDAFVVNLKKGSTDPVTRSNSVQWLWKDWFAKLGFTGASSHSGRRTFITKAARSLSAVGGTLKDLQILAGHQSIQMTTRYVECDPDAQRKLVSLL